MDDHAKELIERLEARMDTQVTLTNNKLDSLLDLARSISMMQVVQTHHADELSRLNAKLTTSEADYKLSFTRAHQRIDDALVSAGNALVQATAATEKRQDAVVGRIDSSVKIVDRLEKEVHKYLNRGWGVLALGAIVVTSAQYLVQQGIEAIKTSNSEQTAAIKRNEVRLNELETMVSNILAAGKSK
jgi:hypothetical protein